MFSSIKKIVSGDIGASAVDKSFNDPGYLSFKIESNAEVQKIEQFFGKKLNITFNTGANQIQRLYAETVYLREVLPPGYSAVYVDKARKIVAIADESGQIVSSTFAIINGKLITDVSKIEPHWTEMPKGSNTSQNILKTGSTTNPVTTEGNPLKQGTITSKISTQKILQYGGIAVAAIILLKLIFGQRKTVIS